MDKAHMPGGFYRVGDRVVDAAGKDLGDEAVKMADKIDKDAVKTANAEADKIKEQQSLAGIGGVGSALLHLLGSASPQLREQMKHAPVTEPKAASQEEQVKVPGGRIAAEITGDAGPTPLQPRSIVAPRVATDSPADLLEDHEDVIARGDERQEELEEASVAAAGGTAVAPPKKKAAKKAAAPASSVTE